MYRPEGWKNAFTKASGNLHPEADKEANIYEAGANAMLEDLRKEGQHVVFRDNSVFKVPLRGKGSGTFVFIPDEENGREA